jgi:carnitine monooxygenase subunit
MNAPQTLSKADQLTEVHRALQRRLVEHISNGRTTDMADAPLRVSSQIYTDPARLDAERKELFLKLPLVAGLSNDIPHVGDTMLFDGAGPSIIIIRDQHGKANAFLNLCTHRGTQLIKECGKHETISCPFHGWTFDPQGQLIGQPGSEAFSGIERDTLGLIHIPCTELHGIIFVKVQPGEQNIDVEVKEFLGDFGHQLSLLDFARYLPGKSGMLQSNGNWKYVAETFGEGYHFAALHPTSLGQTHYNNVAAYQSFGRHHQISFAPKTCKELANKPESEWFPLDSVMYSIFPNTQILFGCPRPGALFIQLFRIYPLGVSGTEVHLTLYASEEIFASAGREFVEGAYDLAAGIVEGDDLAAAGTAQRVLKYAPANYQVTYGRNEIALQHFHRNLANAIRMPI